MSETQLSSLEQFQASLKYFFFLFRKEFTPVLEEASRRQWSALKEGDALVTEDGQNNPLVELRLDPDFGRAICAALADSNGALPSLSVPQAAEQVSFWQARAAASAGSAFPAAVVELSENTSHWETIREALSWYIASQGPQAHADPLKVCILGASARYEYAAQGGGIIRFLEWLTSAMTLLAPTRRAEFLLCGRDVPAELHGQEHAVCDGRVVVRHRVGYLHDLEGLDGNALKGTLYIALHSGIGLEHPELSTSWPPTLMVLKSAAPVYLAVSSFNPVEHETAQQCLRSAFAGQLAVDRGGVNCAGSLSGPEVVGPFDGVQGKRNYCILHARVNTPPIMSNDGWDLF